MNQQQIKNQNIYELKITREPVKPVKPIANDRLLMRFQHILFVREKGYAVINVNVFPEVNEIPSEKKGLFVALYTTKFKVNKLSVC